MASSELDLTVSVNARPFWAAMEVAREVGVGPSALCTLADMGVLSRGESDPSGMRITVYPSDLMLQMIGDAKHG